MMLRVPQAVSASSRSSGYPDPPWLPGCLAKRARLAGVSGTLMVVPSIAHTSSPYQRTPVVAPTAAAPRSRSNSQRSVDHLERHELGELSQMAGGEHTRGDPDRGGDGLHSR